MTAFDRLHPAVQYHVANGLGWAALRPVQELTVAAALAGANAVVLAPTAGGKTEAALLPLLSETLRHDWPAPSVLYLSPIKALLNNQIERLGRLYGLVGRRAAVWHGDVARTAKDRTLDDPPDCLLTTPESVEGMLISPSVPRSLWANLRAVVVDEAHAFAGDDRGWHLLALVQRLQRLAGRDLQRLGLSATVGNPDEVLAWLSAGSDRPRRLVRPPDESGPVPDVTLDHVGSLDNAVRVVAALHRGEKRLVFCDSRSRVERVATGEVFDDLPEGETDAMTEDDFDRPAREFFASVADPEELHVFAGAYNWDAGTEDLYHIIRHPLCDLGTALRVSWRGQPVYDLPYPHPDAVPAVNRDVYDLPQEIEGRVAAGAYRTASQPFDPADDDDLRPKPARVKRYGRDLPPAMYRAVPATGAGGGRP